MRKRLKPIPRFQTEAQERRFWETPKGEGMLLVPVPKLQELAGVARGAKSRGYRDRSDRV
jgi:hypothetical protein